MKLHLAFLTKLIVACAALLVLPAAAVAAPTPASVALKAAPSAEGGQAVFTISCGTTAVPLPLIPEQTGPSLGQIDYTTGGGTATETVDYTKTSGSVTCGPGPASTHEVSVPIVADGTDEPNEQFNFTISAGDGFTGAVSGAAASATIPDDDAPLATFEDYLVRVEETGGSVTMKVKLDHPSWQVVSVPYSTLDASASAGADYTATSGTLSFPVGQTERTFTIPIADDTADEPAEAFYVTLGDNPSGVVYDNTKRQAAVAIFDDDAPPVPTFSLAQNERVAEGDSGVVNMIFTVNLSFAYHERTQVAWKTASWTASLADYEGGQGILVFEKGETSKTFSVNVKGDTRKEDTELFAVIIEKPTFGTLGQDKALGIIDDDDQADGGGGPAPAEPGPKVKIAKPTREGRRFSTLLTCPLTASACNGKLTATAGKLRVGRKSFELTAGGKTDLTFKMARRAFRKLKKRALRVKFTVVARNAEGGEGTSSRTFRIRRIRR